MDTPKTNLAIRQMRHAAENIVSDEGVEDRRALRWKVRDLLHTLTNALEHGATYAPRVQSLGEDVARLLREPTPEVRKLGRSQLGVLEALERHEQWHVGRGWTWNTPSGTDRIMKSLVRLGLADCLSEEYGTGGYGRYRINDDGRRAVVEARQARADATERNGP